MRLGGKEIYINLHFSFNCIFLIKNYLTGNISKFERSIAKNTFYHGKDASEETITV